jgi:hypothetical protein
MMSDVTRILSAIERGDPSAAEQLLPLVYDELRELAAQKLAHEKPGQTLEATALVHEACLRLVPIGGHESAEQEPRQWHRASPDQGRLPRVVTILFGRYMGRGVRSSIQLDGAGITVFATSRSCSRPGKGTQSFGIKRAVWKKKRYSSSVKLKREVYMKSFSAVVLLHSLVLCCPMGLRAGETAAVDGVEKQGGAATRDGGSVVGISLTNAKVTDAGLKELAALAPSRICGRWPWTAPR